MVTPIVQFQNGFAVTHAPPLTANYHHHLQKNNFLKERKKNLFSLFLALGVCGVFAHRTFLSNNNFHWKIHAGK